ncbi:hypothetical protein M2105_005984 [Paenibacillus sp. PastF-1]|nr:hypothetical protein [Paenibacillus sp. PastF-2]MDF9851501.1 hypothetical protein [Paenibacillus sp. PastM-2]MDF9858085.1 hypothetical protein [Paenibacillus sp. PastF-1]MDH6483328.1 hypothetical protein [Paenibacillus sp. PastH-2]MDH6510737.1 hypothetical protein [Paenibacillus sp. PastM-3]
MTMGMLTAPKTTIINIVRRLNSSLDTGGIARVNYCMGF